MHLAMVIGEQRLALEQRLLNRLAVGLMAEGVQLVRIVPAGLPTALMGESERRMALVPRIETVMKSFPLTRGMHVRRVAETLAENPPDALLLLGREAWTFGLQLARELDRPAALEVWSLAHATALPRTASHPHMAAVTAPCEGIAQALQGRIGPDLIARVPMGVAAPRRFRRVLADTDQPPSIAVLGGARDVAAYAAMFDGLARVLRQCPSLQVMLELRGPQEHDVWRLAERSGLLGAVSAFSSASQHHALLMRCDLALWPERYGELRSILLEAMAMAVPVVAAADRALDMLVDGTTARLIANETPEKWSDAVSALLANPQDAQAMGMRGRGHVLAHHRSSEQVAKTLDLLQRLVGRDAYAFPGAGV